MPKTPHKSSSGTHSASHHNPSSASSATPLAAAASSSSSASVSLSRRQSRHLTTRSSVSMEKDIAPSASVSSAAHATKGASSSSTTASGKAQSGPVVVKGYVVPGKEKEKDKPEDPNNPTPWRHPAELPYICRDDWSQDLIIEYLCQKSFSVPGKEHSSAVQLIQVTPYRSPSSSSTGAGSTNKDVVYLPRGYRVPLMFVAKFQWESLRLVLTSANPTAEWEEYKYDIVHLSRLCQHLFEQARKAYEKAAAVNPAAIPLPGSTSGSGRAGSVPSGKGTKTGAQLNELGVSAGPGGGPGATAQNMKRTQPAPEGVFDKTWRSPMFDRVLTRFYRKWFVSRDWSLKNFYYEFEEEEYEIDVLKYDWARWAIKGHKGFMLTKEEVLNGITAEQFMRGLGKTKDGKWTWVTPSSSSSTSSSNPLNVITNGTNGSVNGATSATQVLAQAEQSGNAPPSAITPTIPTATVSAASGPTPTSSGLTNTVTGAPTSGSFTTVEVKRELLENGVLAGPANANKGKEKGRNGTDRESSDDFAMITHPTHSDPQPTEPSATPSPQPTKAAAVPKPAQSKPAATASTSASAPVKKAKTSSSGQDGKDKSKTVTMSTSQVIGKKRSREEEEHAKKPTVQESASAGPAPKHRRTMQTARKSMSNDPLWKKRIDQAMAAKISSSARSSTDKQDEEEDSQDSSSSSEDDDENDGDYIGRSQAKNVTGQKRKSSINGSSGISANGKAALNGSASANVAAERTKKKAKLDHSSSTPSAAKPQIATMATAMKSSISGWPTSGYSHPTSKTTSTSASATANAKASASASASASKPAPKMMIASTEPVKKAPVPAIPKTATSSASAVGSAVANTQKAASTKDTTAKPTKLVAPTDSSTSYKPAPPTQPAASTVGSALAQTQKATLTKDTPARPTTPSVSTDSSTLNKPTPPTQPVPGYSYIFSVGALPPDDTNLPGPNMRIMGDRALNGTGSQGAVVEPPIPVDVAVSWQRMKCWMRKPPQSLLELADPITKLMMKYMMADFGLGPKMDKIRTEEVETLEDKGKDKAKQVTEEVQAVDPARGKEKEKSFEREARDAPVANKEEKVSVTNGVKEAGQATAKEVVKKAAEGVKEVSQTVGPTAASSPGKGYTDEQLVSWLSKTYPASRVTRTDDLPLLKEKSPPRPSTLSRPISGVPEDSAALLRKVGDRLQDLQAHTTPPPPATTLPGPSTSEITRPTPPPAADKPTDVVAPAAATTSSSSVGNEALPTPPPRAATPSPASPSSASSMSISVSPSPVPPIAENEPKLVIPSTSSLPAASNPSNAPAVPSTNAPAFKLSSLSPRHPSISANSPVIPSLPTPIITPTLVHPPIPLQTSAPSTTTNAAVITPKSPAAPVPASTVLSPILSSTSSSFKGKAMPTILSVIPSIPIERRPSVANIPSMTSPPASAIEPPKLATAVTSLEAAGRQADIVPAEKPTTSATVSLPIVLQTAAEILASRNQVDESVADSGSAHATTSGVSSGSVSREPFVEKAPIMRGPPEVNGLLAPPGVQDMATTAEDMVREDLAGSRVRDGVSDGILRSSPKVAASGADRDDKMDVDVPVPVVNGTSSHFVPPPVPTSPATILHPVVNGAPDESARSDHSVGLLMAEGNRSRSLHTILLLRDLLKFLLIPGPRQANDVSRDLKADSNPTFDTSIVDPRSYYSVLEGEENMTIEQRVDILAHASIALAKALFPFRGSEAELETRISSLDNRLHEQFDMLLKPEQREKALEILRKAAKDAYREKELAKEVIERTLEEKGVQTSEVDRKTELPYAESSVQTESEEALVPVAPSVEMDLLSRLDLGIQTEVVEEAKQGEVEKIFQNFAMQTEAEEIPLAAPESTPPNPPGPDALTRWAPDELQRRPSQLTPDATMVDLTAIKSPSPPPKVPASLSSLNDASKILLSGSNDRSNPAAKAMTSIMRNIADLIEYSTQEGSTTTRSTVMSPKGKEREISVDRDVEMSTAVQRYSGSPVVDAILSEFRAMKEELRVSQQQTREELDAIKTLHRSGYESHEDGPRSRAKGKAADDGANEEMEELKRRHHEEVKQLRETIQKMERDREKTREALEEERLPALELLELRRRISSLEVRARSEAETPGGPTPGPPPNASPAPTLMSDSSATQPRSHHPLGHLLTHDLDDAGSLASPIPGRSYVREASTNPGTPLSGVHSFSTRHGDAMDVEESVPLPIKSQRKMHVMMFPRPSVG